jgi:hypothetical protein
MFGKGPLWTDEGQVRVAVPRRAGLWREPTKGPGRAALKKIVRTWPSSVETCAWRESVDGWHSRHWSRPRPAASVGRVTIIAPVLIGLIYAAVNSLIRAEHRRPFNALMIAGAGAAYLSGGFGPWELAFTTVMTYVAYRGLTSWRWIGVGWLLHTAWDVVHYLHGRPLLPFAHSSSLGCAICDPVIALWCFAGGPSTPDLLRHWFRRRATSR